MADVDNSWYDDLGDAWWDRNGPMRALHEVNPVRLEYFLGVLGDVAGRRVLDLGCGGGLMTEAYARAGAHAVGIDISRPSLGAARRHALSESIASSRYLAARAEALPFPDACFDAVCSADSLEHVDDLFAVLAEAERVLRPGGLFVFDTVNRTWMSKLIMIWAAQTLLRFAPPRTHSYAKFVPPELLRNELERRGMQWGGLRGLSLRRNPIVAAWSYARSGSLGGFVLSDDTRVSYVGYARKPSGDPAF